MRGIKKILFSIWSIFIFYIMTIRNFVNADLISPMEIHDIINYSPLYYIAIFIIIAIIVGISIFILRRIYKSNQLEKDEKGEKA